MSVAAILNKVTVALKFPSLFELQGEWVADEAQQRAAWEIYVELVSRISTEALVDENGQPVGLIREALSSLYTLFGTTREVLRRGGPSVGRPVDDGTLSVGVIALDVLNHGIRPFTAKWHPALLEWEAKKANGVSAAEHERAWPEAAEARAHLKEVQMVVRQYAGLLELAMGISRHA